MINLNQVESVRQFNGDPNYVSSLYLRFDSQRPKAGADALAVKSIIQTKKRKLARWGLTTHQQQEVSRDLGRIQDFVNEGLDRRSSNGLALFACGPRKLWEVIYLPQGFPSDLFINPKPHITPLLSLIQQYHRWGVLLVDRGRARFVEVYLGAVGERITINSDVPPKVKAGGFAGYSAKRIARHIEDRVHQHWKEVADQVFRYFKQNRFDFLILGGNLATLKEFWGSLHPYLEERIVDQWAVPIQISLSEVLQRTSEVEMKLRRQWGDEKVGELQEKQKLGKAVLGVRETLKALQLGRLASLYLVEPFKVSGTHCSSCDYLGERGERRCPHCAQPLEKIPDLGEEVARQVLGKNRPVEYVPAGGRLERFGKMGGLLI
ncbi:MAG: hypothetical protein HY538_04590 [Deltaproteobacteria bacterium]|nr:hypothetical protein [Deltaproteobacteria bacterium]